MTNTRRSASRTTPRSMTSSQLNLRPYEPTCARCAPRSKHLADKSDVNPAGNARPAVQVFFPGTAERPSQRKQVFAAALKRINKELERLHKLAARTAHVEAARQALALHRAANFIPYPSAGATASEGMAPLPSRRRKTIMEGAKIGRISQATKIAQAVRDTRGV
jgi:hypothetical protein